MNCKIEAKSQTVINLLTPILTVVEDYDRHINASGRFANAAYIQDDNRNKEALLCLIRQQKNSELFQIGSGNGHVWIGVPFMDDVFFNAHQISSKAFFNDMIGNRVCLITDKI